jgi:putative transposase
MLLQILLVMLAGWLQRHQQRVITYLHEENRVLKARLCGQRLCLTDTERRRLATLAYPLGRKRLKEVATIATPDTRRRWSRRLIAQQFDGSKHRRPRGRPRVAEENPTWGYGRIQGALANLGFCIDAGTVRNILCRHHLEPAPRCRETGMRWTQFLKRHWEVLAATDVFTVEVVTWHGMVTYSILLVMELATRCIPYVAGITPHPTAAFMQQCARQLLDPVDGFLLGKHSVIHARETTYPHACEGFLKASGVEPVILPPRSPSLHPHCERFVCSIKDETLHRLLMLGERALHYTIQ